MRLITHNRALMNTKSKFIINTKTSPLNKPVLLDMLDCMLFCSGLVYLNFCMKLPIDTALIMELPLVKPLTSSSLCNTQFGTLFNTVIQRESFLAPSSNAAYGLDLHNIFLISYLLNTNIEQNFSGPIHHKTRRWSRNHESFQEPNLLWLGTKKSSKSKPDIDNINTNAEDTLTRVQEITQCAGLPSVDSLDLLGYTFVCENDYTKQRVEVKEFRPVWTGAVLK